MSDPATHADTAERYALAGRGLSTRAAVAAPMRAHWLPAAIKNIVRSAPAASIAPSSASSNATIGMGAEEETWTVELSDLEATGDDDAAAWASTDESNALGFSHGEASMRRTSAVSPDQTVPGRTTSDLGTPGPNASQTYERASPTTGVAQSSPIRPASNARSDFSSGRAQRHRDDNDEFDPAQFAARSVDEARNAAAQRTTAVSGDAAADVASQGMRNDAQNSASAARENAVAAIRRHARAAMASDDAATPDARHRLAPGENDGRAEATTGLDNGDPLANPSHADRAARVRISGDVSKLSHVDSQRANAGDATGSDASGQDREAAQLRSQARRGANSASDEPSRASPPPSRVVEMGLPNATSMDRARKASAAQTNAADLAAASYRNAPRQPTALDPALIAALLAPSAASSGPSVTIDRVQVTVQAPPSPKSVAHPTPSSAPSSPAAAVPRGSAGGVGHRNPWASYFTRRD